MIDSVDVRAEVVEVGARQAESRLDDVPCANVDARGEVIVPDLRVFHARAQPVEPLVRTRRPHEAVHLQAGVMRQQSDSAPRTIVAAS